MEQITSILAHFPQIRKISRLIYALIVTLLAVTVTYQLSKTPLISNQRENSS